LIICDIHMPRMSGVELLHIVRQRFPHLPMIAMLGECLPGDMPKGLAADAYYYKGGLGFDALLQTVTRLTGESPSQTYSASTEDKAIQARLDGDEHYIIDCGDCLRPFSVLRTPYTGQQDHWTTCVHCGSTVRFLTDSSDLQG